MKKLLLLGFIALFLMSCATFDIMKTKLSIDKIVFCSDVRGYQDYTEKPKSTFTYYEPFYIYVEMENIKIEDGMVSLLMSMVLTGPDGTIILDVVPVDYYGPEMEPYTSIGLAVPYGAENGKYKVDISVTDRLSGEEAYKSNTFIVDIETDELKKQKII